MVDLQYWKSGGGETRTGGVLRQRKKELGIAG
jgi:hypothetical protein